MAFLWLPLDQLFDSHVVFVCSGHSAGEGRRVEGGEEAGELAFKVGAQ